MLFEVGMCRKEKTAQFLAHLPDYLFLLEMSWVEKPATGEGGGGAADPALSSSASWYTLIQYTIERRGVGKVKDKQLMWKDDIWLLFWNLFV